MARPAPRILLALLALSLVAAAPAQAIGPDHFTVTVSPRPVKVGVPTTLTAVARDKAGAVLSGYSGPVTFGDKAGALFDRPATFVGGVATAPAKWPAPL